MEKNKGSAENIRFIFKNLKGNRGKIFVSIIFSLISTLAKLAPYVLIVTIVDQLMSAQADLVTVKKYAIYTGIFVVVSILSNVISLAMSHISAFNILYNIRIAAINHMGNLNLGFFRKNSSGKLKKALDDDVEKIELFIAHQIPDFVSAIFAPLIIIVYLFTIKWYLALLLFVPFIIAVGAQAWSYTKFGNKMTFYNNLLKNMNSTIVQYIHGINVFKAFNLKAKTFKNYVNVVNEYCDYWKEICDKTISSYALAYAIIDSGGLLIVIPIGGILFIQNGLTFSGFVIFLFLSTAFLLAFFNLVYMGANLAMLLIGTENVREIMERDEQSDGLNEKLEDIRGEIEYKNVNFAYEQKDVIKNFNLKLKPDTITALVGPSGSGKTTLGMLVGRFWDITDGEILIDEKNINNISVDEIMKNTSFVFQEVYILNDTIYNNIILGLEKTKEEVIYACKEAQIHDFIMSLPDGYETFIGEGSGRKLSGGEKQRISVARAILKNAKIVVLDEVTSYSDIDNEKHIQEALVNLLKNKTAIIIAHRLYTIKNADNIVVLDKGEKIEEGTHAELLKLEGLYASMWSRGLEGETSV